MRRNWSRVFALTHHVARSRLRMRGFESRFVDTSSGRVHALAGRGQGGLPPVVMLHGLSAAGHHFGRMLVRLRRETRGVVAPDLPGHGFSEPPLGGSPVRAMHDGLLEGLDQLVTEPSVLFGSSMGGFAAVRYAQHRPDRVRGLVLCSPGGAAMDPAELQEFLQGFELRSHAEALAFVDRFMARRTWLRPFLAWGVRKSMSPAHIRGLLSSMTAEELLVPENLSALRMPVLLIWGREERVLSDASFEFYRTHLPEHAEIERPPHYGHAPYLEHPGCVTDKLLGFLRRLPRSDDLDDRDDLDALDPARVTR